MGDVIIIIIVITHGFEFLSRFYRVDREKFMRHDVNIERCLRTQGKGNSKFENLTTWLTQHFLNGLPFQVEPTASDCFQPKREHRWPPVFPCTSIKLIYVPPVRSIDWYVVLQTKHMCNRRGVRRHHHDLRAGHNNNHLVLAWVQFVFGERISFFPTPPRGWCRAMIWVRLCFRS